MILRIFNPLSLGPICVAVGLTLLNCGQVPSTHSTTKNIFGTDDRIPFDQMSDANLWGLAIGKYKTEEGTFCTATLVAMNLVLTTAHCVIDAETGQPISGTGVFQTGFLYGKPKFEAKVKGFWYGTREPVKKRFKDWAVLKIDWTDSITKDTETFMKLQPLQVRPKNPDPAQLPKQVRFVAFHSDKKNGYELYQQDTGKPCSLKKFTPKDKTKDDKKEQITEEKRLAHDCDMAGGSSGAPLLSTSETGRIFIEALSTSEMSDGKSVARDEHTDDNTNFAIGVGDVAEFLDQVSSLDLDDKKLTRLKDIYYSDAQPARVKTCDVEDMQAGSFKPVDSRGNKIGNHQYMNSAHESNKGSSNIADILERPVSGLTRTQCQTAIRRQSNGLICGPGYYYNIYRASDGKIMKGSSFYMAGFKSFDSCIKLVEFSTKRLFCAPSSTSSTVDKIIAAVKFEDNKDIKHFTGDNREDDCLAYIQQLETQKVLPKPMLLSSNSNTPANEVPRTSTASVSGNGPVTSTPESTSTSYDQALRLLETVGTPKVGSPPSSSNDLDKALQALAAAKAPTPTAKASQDLDRALEALTGKAPTTPKISTSQNLEDALRILRTAKTLITPKTPAEIDASISKFVGPGRKKTLQEIDADISKFLNSPQPTATEVERALEKLRISSPSHNLSIINKDANGRTWLQNVTVPPASSPSNFDLLNALRK